MDSWLKELKVGDTVCDCKYRHLKVVHIDEERYMPKWLSRIDMRLPEKLSDLLNNFYYANFEGHLWDKRLTLEDGSTCSAFYCCGPADHETKHE